MRELPLRQVPHRRVQDAGRGSPSPNPVDPSGLGSTDPPKHRAPEGVEERGAAGEPRCRGVRHRTAGREAAPGASRTRGAGGGGDTVRHTETGCGRRRAPGGAPGGSRTRGAGGSGGTGRFTDTGCEWLPAPGRTVQSPRPGSPAAKAEAAPRAPETGAAEPSPSSPRLSPLLEPPARRTATRGCPRRQSPTGTHDHPHLPLPGQEPPRPSASPTGHRALGAPAAQPPPSRAPAAASPLPAAGASHGGCREAAPSCR